MITSKAGRRVSLQKELKMYDKLWEESPTVQKMRAESEAIGLAEGELRALKRVFINVIKVRLPLLWNWPNRK